MASKQKKLQHLYWRAGFGETYGNIKQAMECSIEDAVENIFAQAQEVEYLHWANPDSLTLINSKAAAHKQRKLVQQLNVKWFWQMVDSAGFLREKMALFWHNHFSSEHKKPFVVQRQLNLLKEHALGNFGELLMAVSKDPVMLSYLNNRVNHKNHPNENFAREVMELFTLGIGNYTEKDITEAARAFTGWDYNRKIEFVFRRKKHDKGQKTILGQTGAWQGEDVIRILLEQKQTARHICTKIYKAFVNEQVDGVIVEKLTDQFYASNYDINQLMYTIFTSEWFYEDKNIGQLIKSPIEYLAGLCRTLRLGINNDDVLLFLQKSLGQILLDPPNVAGWPGGQTWIDGSTLLLRLRIAEFLFDAAGFDFEDRDRGDIDATFQNFKKIDTSGVFVDWFKLKKDFDGLNGQLLIKTIAEYIAQVPMPTANIVYGLDELASTESFRRMISNSLNSPEYQLC